MAEKIYYLADLEKLKKIAAEMGLKAWKLENLSGAELQKPNPAIKPGEALERIFNYLKSEVIPDGKYLLIGKTGHRSIHRTEIYIQKGNDSTAASSGSGAIAYTDYSDLIKENAKLKAENYFFSEQVKVLHDQIAELREALEDEDEDEDEKAGKTSIYEDMAKEYAPQLINIFTQFLSPKSSAPVVSFADPSTPPPGQKIVRFTEPYYNYWRNCTDQEAINREYNYLQANKPDKLEAFTAIFTSNE